jgi:hypothetical protein
VSQESLQLQGFITANLTSGHPNSCGVGGGSSGTSFYFGLYFQIDGTRYSPGFYTDPAVRQYTGTGTYTARAWLYGPTQKLYEGKVQLTVTSDRRPDNGSVQGTLDPVGSFSQRDLDLHARPIARSRLGKSFGSRLRPCKPRGSSPGS